MNTTPLITKLNTFYGAYAPEFDVCAYGDCRDEALNNLNDIVRGKVAETTDDERNSHAVV